MSPKAPAKAAAPAAPAKAAAPAAPAKAVAPKAGKKQAPKQSERKPKWLKIQRRSALRRAGLKKARHEKPKKEQAKQPKKPEGKKKSGERAKKVQITLKQKRAIRLENRRKLQKAIVQRVLKYKKEYAHEERVLNQNRRQALKHGNFYVEPEAKVAFVIRIRGRHDMPPKAQKILQLLRLKGTFNGVFVKLNKSTNELLRRVAPWVTWGYPSVASVRKLILKRGFGKFRGQRIKLESNYKIQKRLNAVGIKCVDDIIHEIYTAGQNFRMVNNFLWPFKLSAPSGGLKKKRVHFVEGGDYGNRETFINPFIKRVL